MLKTQICVTRPLLCVKIIQSVGLQRFVCWCRWSAKIVRCSVASVRTHELQQEARNVAVNRHTYIINTESVMNKDCTSDINNTLNAESVTFVDSLLITGGISQYGLTE